MKFFWLLMIMNLIFSPAAQGSSRCQGFIGFKNENPEINDPYRAYFIDSVSDKTTQRIHIVEFDKTPENREAAISKARAIVLNRENFNLSNNKPNTLSANFELVFPRSPLATHLDFLNKEIFIIPLKVNSDKDSAGKDNELNWHLFNGTSLLPKRIPRSASIDYFEHFGERSSVDPKQAIKAFNYLSKDSKSFGYLFLLQLQVGDKFIDLIFKLRTNPLMAQRTPRAYGMYLAHKIGLIKPKILSLKVYGELD